MAVLVEKSSTYSSCGESLLAIDDFAICSVHCHYYSTFQLLKYTLYYAGVLPPDADERQLCEDARKGVHYLFIHLIRQENIRKVGNFQARRFDQDIKTLKSLREKADYQDRHENWLQIGDQARRLSLDLNNKLRILYH